MAGLKPVRALDRTPAALGRARVSIFFLFIGFLMVLVQGGLVRPLSKRFGEGPLVVAGSLLMSAGLQPS